MPRPKDFATRHKNTPNGASFSCRRSKEPKVICRPSLWLQIRRWTERVTRPQRSGKLPRIRVVDLDHDSCRFRAQCRLHQGRSERNSAAEPLRSISGQPIRTTALDSFNYLRAQTAGRHSQKEASCLFTIMVNKGNSA